MVPRSLVVALILITAPARADDPRPPAKPTEPLKLPPGTVILITDNPADALGHPNTVVLSAAEYRRLLDAAEAARKAATPDRPEPPSVCLLTGRVAGDVAAVTATYQFRTTQPRAAVPLGGQEAFAATCRLDGKESPALAPDKDGGVSAVVELPGDHTLVVEWEVPVTSRPGKAAERGVEFGLPGSAITAVERFELPAGVGRARVVGRAVAAKALAEGGAVLGPAKLFDLAWESAAAAGDPQTVAESRVEARADDRELTVKQRLTLKVTRGQVGEWRLLAPPTADVQPGPGLRAERTRDPKRPGWTLTREPSADDATLDVTIRVPLLKRPVAVPVATVAGAAAQRGTVALAAAPGWKVLAQAKGDLARREPPDDASRDQHWAYAALPPGTGLDIVDVVAVRGETEATAHHQLTLAERGWRWQGRFELKPVRQEVDRFELDVPPELTELRAASPELVESLGPARELPNGRRVVQVRLADGRRKPFAVVLEGLVPLPGPATAAAFDLPRLRDAVDRGGSVLLLAPAGVDVRGAVHEWEGDRPGAWERAAEPVPRGVGWQATTDRAPAGVDLVWRTAAGDRPAQATVDVTVDRRQASVRQVWRLPLPSTAARQVVARAPASVAAALRLLDGGTLVPARPGEWSVLLPPTGTEATLTFAFAVPLPATAPEPVAVPLVWLDAAPQCETEVRLWAAPDAPWPAFAAGPWAEQPPRLVPGRAEWPAAVAVGRGPDLPLALALGEAVAPTPDGVIERAWVQVAATDDGWQWRVRLRARPGAAKQLSFAWPADAAPTGLVGVWNGQRVPARPLPRAGESPAWAFRAEPSPGDAAGVLDLFYRTARTAPVWGWQRPRLTPPRPLDAAAFAPARWQWASNDMALPLGGAFAPADQLRVGGGGLALEPAWSADAQAAWFAVPQEPPFPAALAGTLPLGEPLSLLTLPHGQAVGVASLAALAACGGLMRLTAVGRRVVLLVGVALIGTATVIGVGSLLSRVAVLAVPGGVVAVLTLAGIAAYRSVERRRVRNLPAFTRRPAARSSLIAPVPREPSTIDQPPPGSFASGIAGRAGV